jgi:hypothetical protein
MRGLILILNGNHHLAYVDRVDLLLLIHQLPSCLHRLRSKYFVHDLIPYVGSIDQNVIDSFQGVGD